MLKKPIKNEYDTNEDHTVNNDDKRNKESKTKTVIKNTKNDLQRVREIDILFALIILLSP